MDRYCCLVRTELDSTTNLSGGSFASNEFSSESSISVSFCMGCSFKGVFLVNGWFPGFR